jgi:predicted transposase YdaD
LKKVLLPARLPGVELPELGDLNEVNTMLAERVMEWTRQWKAEGLQEGIEKGREEGRKSGETALLRKMLELKYGPIPEWVEDRIAQADATDIEQWAANLLNAQTLEAVFHPES